MNSNTAKSKDKAVEEAAVGDEMPAADPQAWDAQTLSNPHAVADKARRVERMFSAIAPSYDLNNRLHSMGRDQAWRRAAVKIADVKPGDVVLDVACGTGDLSMAFAEAKPAAVRGVDFTYDMLVVADRKKSQIKAATPVSYTTGDAMRLPLPDASVDVVSIAFGIRNVVEPATALAEFYRVLRPGGRVVVLEFSLPGNPVMRAGYNFYFRQVLPRTATWISGDRTGAYRYLPQSVNTFLGREQLVSQMEATGLTDVKVKPLTFGIAVLYRGVKTGA